MPKKIENIKEEILVIAKKKLKEEGYETLTIRSLAKECKIAVGTVYNYFENKDILIAMVMRQDWKLALDKMHIATENAHSIEEGMRYIYNALLEFSNQYKSTWKEYAGTSNPMLLINERHGKLRSQISKFLQKLVLTYSEETSLEFCDIFSDILLQTATQDEVSFEVLNRLIIRTFKEGKDE